MTANPGAPTVGLIGLGVMGRALATRLARQGARVVATTRSQQGRDAASSIPGVEAVETPAQLASTLCRELPDGPLPVLISVTAGAQVREVVTGPDGVCAGTPAGRQLLVIDTSTCSPLDARELDGDLHRQGHAALDAPVSGGPAAIAAGTLSVMVGGRDVDLDAARPVLDLFAGTVVHCGRAGAGQVTKAANQLLVACTLQAVAESLALVAAHGVDPRAARTVLLGGYASSPVLDLAGDRMIDGDFRTVGSMALLAKDLDIVDALATEAGVDTPAADVVRSRAHAIALDRPDIDHAALVTLVAPDGLRGAGSAPSAEGRT